MNSDACRILYVDDDLDNCELMSTWLSKGNADYTVTSVSTPQKAMNLITQEQYDLYIFDYSMPEVDGADLCYFVRKLHPEARIMIYSGRAQKTDVKNGIDAGANAFLIKPNDFDKFLPTVEELLHAN